MCYKFLEVNIPSATFAGLSYGYQRKLALVVTLLIWAGVSIFLIEFVWVFKDTRFVKHVMPMALLINLCFTILGEPFLPTSAAKLMFNITPLGVVYRHDQKVVDRARAELFRISKRVDFYTYLAYGKINPDINAKKNLLIIAHQKKGDLEIWTGSVRNLHRLADLVYQIYLVEVLLSSEEIIF